ncbi:hypothetical protein BES34_014165 [Leptospira inadai serovar Lyme]|uniref:Uncharacterized protein n=1 Tax=Leptospira inadai serovar Lyme TaxID=293084 RepID=A0ABX4YGZ2_9LEPT|nr:hypothetical protein BES34_014165 [Leptospira inadai serovar Lyme]
MDLFLIIFRNFDLGEIFDLGFSYRKERGRINHSLRSLVVFLRTAALVRLSFLAISPAVKISRFDTRY